MSFSLQAFAVHNQEHPPGLGSVVGSTSLDSREQRIVCMDRRFMVPSISWSQRYRPKKKEALALHGWYSHFVILENDRQDRVNYHTHGLAEHYGHLDFQLVLPIEPSSLHDLAARLVERVKKGERFVAGMRVSRILKNYDVLLVKMNETHRIERPILRVILPDKDGNLNKGSVSSMFATQFEELPE
jgi:hypothetical protein